MLATSGSELAKIAVRIVFRPHEKKRWNGTLLCRKQEAPNHAILPFIPINSDARMYRYSRRRLDIFTLERNSC